jgi:hypothetical protein
MSGDLGLAIRTAAILSLALGCALPIASLETTLEWRAGQKTVVFEESLSPSGAGWTATIGTNIGERDNLEMDARRSTTEWRRSYPAEGTELRAVRRGAEVLVEGTYKGRPYSRRHDFGDAPWFQFQELSYEELFASGAATAGFWTIDRASLKPTYFTARRESGSATIELGGKSVEAIEYSLTVRGLPPALFTARFWLRSRDGRFLRLDVPSLLGLPRSSVELRSEK